MLYEIKGVREGEEVSGLVTSKHLKSVTDIHEGPVVSIKFFGDLSFNQKKISIVSCDLEGIVYLSYFSEALIGYQCVKQCFMRKRVGPTFTIAPFILGAQLKSASDDDMVPGAAAPISPYQQEQLEAQSNNNMLSTQLIAFGSLSRILIAQLIPGFTEKG